MAWFRRESEPEQRERAAKAAEADDSPATLRWNLYQLNRYVNANAGKLPGEAVVAARRVTDTLREVIDTSEVRELDVYAVVTVKGVLNDYLPTTLRSYLALDPAVVNTPRPSGHTPTASLIDQLDSLRQAGTEVLSAVRNQDADSLLAQGRFLSAKFTRSDLDL